MPSYIITATNTTDDRDCDWRVTTGLRSWERAMHDFRNFIDQGYRSVHIRELGELFAIATNGTTRTFDPGNQLTSEFITEGGEQHQH